ncbi:MAG: VWA domain-containing protein [Candidatus Sumerlaeia bacterium]|nr:VWA domain-containing protein [Candidatus Sumerlaeia bacterium]
MPFSFLHTGMLWWLAAGAIPIIIHLLNRRRYRPVPWAAMRFLREAIRVNARRIQIEDLILLALRVLVLIFAALAFTLPILKSQLLFFGRQPHVCAVILLDDSYSMNYVDGDLSRFERARTVAREVVGRLNRGDSVSVILMSDRPRRLFREPTFDLDQVRNQLARLECSYAASAAEGALALAREDLAKARQPAHLVCLISDFQKGLLGGAACEALLADLKKNADLVAIPIGEGYDGNLGVVGIETDAGVLAAGIPTVLRARIHNFSQTPQQDYPVELFLDNQRRDRRWVTIPPGGEVDVTFLAEFREAGQHAVEVRIPADSLPTDNARHHVVEVRPKIPILLISGDTAGRGGIGATEYAGMALAPGWLVGELEEDHLSPARVAVGQFRPADLDQYPAVFLVNVATLEADQIAGLERYVREGGGLMIIPGERTDVRFYNENLYRNGEGFLPARITPPGFRTEEGECFLSPDAYDHPALSVFADRSHGDLSQIHFKRTLLVEPPTTASVICKFSTGRPALVERTFGKGRVMLFASGLGRDWSDFIWKPSFLIFMRRVGDYLMRRETAGLNLGVYETATRFIRGGSAATPMTVVHPSGKNDLAELESALGGMRLQYAGVDRPGAYRLITEQQIVGQFAATVDPRESDIGLPPMGLITAPLRIVAPTDVASVTSTGPAGSEFWMTCLKIALALMLIEVLFLLWIERREKRTTVHESV